ncbi:MAG: ribonuclease III [Chlamydiia bacterium]|nr:ribonuclease III [Chlamydiia bacterium]
MYEELGNLEKILGYTFKDRNLLEAAVTHKSANNKSKSVEGNYERLEFIGDSVIGLIVAEYLYNKYKDANEGDLSRMKDSLVSLDACKMYANYLDLSRFMVCGKGILERGFYFKGDLFEALVGAMFIDGGYKKVYDFFTNLFKHFEGTEILTSARSCIAKLQEYAQKYYKSTPDYSMISEEGPDHSKIFHFEVAVNQLKKGTGSGRCKKIAKENAAKSALSNLEGSNGN